MVGCLLATQVRARVTVSEAQVEALLLTSAAGTVLTLLNWREAPVEALSVTIRTGHDVEAVTSVRTGAKLKFASAYAKDGGWVVTFTVRLEDCDFVTLPAKKEVMT